MVRSDEAVATQRSLKLCVLDDTYFTQPQGYIGVNRTKGRFFLILRAAPEAARFFSIVKNTTVSLARYSIGPILSRLMDRSIRDET